MKAAIVIDTSKEIPHKWLEYYNIFPIGYLIKNSKSILHKERKTIRELETSNLLKIMRKDKKSQLLSPSIKDFVELFTYLSEEFDSIICIHSTLITPAVFENAVLAKKLIAEVKIDVIDSPTLGPSSGLLVEELAKFILEAKNINEIRKECFSLNKHIHSFLITKNNRLNSVGIRKDSIFSGIRKSFKPYEMYELYHNSWSNSSSGRNPKSLVKNLTKEIETITKAKEFKKVFYGGSGYFEKSIEKVLEVIPITNAIKTETSLVSNHLLGPNYGSIALL